MTLEQRVEALEKQMTLLSNGRFAVRDGEVFLSDALIQNGEIKAAQIQAAEFRVDSFEIYEKVRDHLLDVAATLMHDSLQLSRL